MNKITAVLVIEANKSNPNGDPDFAGRPRVLESGFGVITDVSIKRKIRDLINDKDGPVWQEMSNWLALTPGSFQIFEIPSVKSSEDKRSNLGSDTYWDVRVFGTTTSTGKGQSMTTVNGPVQLTLAVSVSPVNVVELGITQMSAVTEDGKKDKNSMGSFTFVDHGVYVARMSISTTLMRRSNCSETDLNLLKCVLPYTYSETMSKVRMGTTLLQIWWVEHNNTLGSIPEQTIVDVVSPVRIDEDSVNLPSTSLCDYKVKTLAEVKQELGDRVASVEELIGN